MLMKTENLTDHLFEEDVRLTGITEFGTPWVEFLNGNVAIPHEGARFNISFEGFIDGPRLKGHKKGVDYVYVRADGKFILDIHAEIKTDDGDNIYVHEDGILIPAEDGSAQGELRFTMNFSTSSPRYSWLNRAQVWAAGTVDMEKGVVKIKAYQS